MLSSGSGVVSEVAGRQWVRLLLDESQGRALFAVRVPQRRHLSVGVALLMGALPLLRLVERPVCVEVAAAAKRPEAQDCSCPGLVDGASAVGAGR